MGDSLDLQEESLVSAFRDYLGVLTTISDQQARQRDAERAYPRDLLEEAGRVLKSTAAGLEIADRVEKFTEQAETAAGQITLALVNAGAEDSRKWKQPAIDAMNTLLAFSDYFEEKGLMLYAGTLSFEGPSMLNLYLGKYRRVEMPGTELILFTDAALRDDDCSDDTARVGWATREKSFYYADLAMKYGGAIFSSLNNDDFGSDKEEKKLKELAYAPILEETGGDEKLFSKKYAAIRIGNSFFHEFHHGKIAMHGGNKPERKVEEAGAELYSMMKGNNVFHCLRRLYGWRHQYLTVQYVEAAELALGCMERFGYSERLWSGLEPGSPEARTVEAQIKEQAGKALDLLEKYDGLGNHVDAENELGLSHEKYRQVFDEVSNVINQL